MEKNQVDAILGILSDVILPTDERLLEVGAGDGQFTRALAPHFPRLDWYPTDKNIIHLKDIHKGKIQKAQRLDVSKDDFPKLRFDVVFTAHSFENMHWKDCKSFMKLLGHRLRENARAVICGPFKHQGEFKNEGHRTLDENLKAQDPLTGIRSYEDVHANMVKNGFELVEDHAVPGDDRILVYSRLKFIPKR